MRPILRSYFYRLFRDKLFYISVGIVFGLGLLISLVMRRVQEDTSAGAYFAYGLFLGLNGGELLGSSSVPWIDLLIFSIFGAIRYHKENASGAMRNYIVSGYSRGQVYHALYVGNLVYYLCVLAALVLGSVLPFMGTPLGISADQMGSFFGLIGLSLLTSLGYMTFVYFTYVLLQGHGFAGSMATLIHVFLSIVGSVLSLVVALNLDTFDKVTAKALVIINGILLPSNRGAIAGGISGGQVRFDTMPGALIISSIGAMAPQGSQAYETYQAILNVNWSGLNITTAIVSSLILGLGFYLLGLRINAKRDLK